MTSNIKVAAVTGGIGSMLFASKELGLDILGNVDWRNYNPKDFENYFGRPYTKDYNNIQHLMDADIVFSHDSCGGVSNLRTTEACEADKVGHSPITHDTIARIQPEFFVWENLPKGLELFKPEYWKDKFPDYDIHFEYVSNYHYGNIQKGRKRGFVIGSKKKYNFVFIPDERMYDWNCDNLDIGLEQCTQTRVPNRDEVSKVAQRVCDDNGVYFNTWGDIADYWDKDHRILHYIKKSGEEGTRMGTSVNQPEYCQVVSGGITKFHHTTGLPLSLRQRMRAQGFPDDFEITLDPTKPEIHDKHCYGIGKSISVEFVRYLTKVIVSYLEGTPYKGLDPSGQRLINPSTRVNQVKLEYCKQYTYSNPAVCNYCQSFKQCKGI